MVQQAQVVHGMCLHIGIATQQGVSAIEQTSLTACGECTAIETIAIVIGHRRIKFQGNLCPRIVGLQFLLGNLHRR